MKTKSLCPVCLKIIEAEYINENNNIYLKKECTAHGAFKSLISDDPSLFDRWLEAQSNSASPKTSLTSHSNGCHFDCGPCENHKQAACCVLLEITQRCNQKCPYCFASANENVDNDPTLQQIEKWYDKLKAIGEDRPFNIQISGGEPTVRDDLPQIIKKGKQKGFEYIQLNSNGKRLGLEKNYAKSLKDAGLSVVFLQFDGTNDDIYLKLRGEKLLDIKTQAIKNCSDVNLPVTLVPTVAPDVNVDNIGKIFNFMLDNMPTVRGIHFQPVSYFGRYPSENKEPEHITLFRIMNELYTQTNGKINPQNLYPLQTGHPICSFYGTFIRKSDGSIKSMYVQEEKSQKSCSCCTPSPESLIKRDRDFVKNKWSLPENPGKTDTSGFDAFLNEIKNNSFTITSMAFQDAWSIDLQRLEKCRVHVFSKDETLIPFCAYNLTDINGNSLYRKN